MNRNKNAFKELNRLYKEIFPEETVFEFYGCYGIEVLNGKKFFPLSKKFFFMVEKVGLPYDTVEELTLKTLEYCLGEKVDKDVLYRAEKTPHVRELPLEEHFSEEEVKIIRKKKRVPAQFFEKVKKIFGIEPIVKDYAKDFYRWKNGELRLFPETGEQNAKS